MRKHTEEQAAAAKARKKAYDAQWAAANRDRTKAAGKRWRLAHPEKVKANCAKWLAANPERARERQAQWRAAHRERSNEIARLSYQRNKERIQVRQNATSRQRFLKHRYDLTLEAYEQLLLTQGGCCAICRQPASEPLCVDHDHVTGAIRGLLCDRCNRALGGFQDNPERLTKAVSYLSNVT